ncbi:MAG: hypothetical protein NZ958_03650 [Bacteroidia bacterium]|nr:hypothetical protein [Bacteroidia bacterium]MDW8088313.1 hypothetical protein [Bacteroidia bacterium]
MKRPPTRRTGLRLIARQWMPLALNWLLMAIEGPILVSLISRLPEPTENLAGFSVAFSIALLVESPIMMFLSAGAALGHSRPSYERLWWFASAFNLPLSALMGVLGLPEVFFRLNAHIWHLAPALAQRVAGAIWLLIPWPAAIGYRRLWQGVLIAQGQARRVAWGTLARLAGMLSGAWLAKELFLWPGMWVGAFALSMGVVAEMIAIRLYAHTILRRLPPRSEPPPSYRRLSAFYLPLLWTALLNVALTPLLTGFMAQGLEPLPSLAAYSPVMSTAFLFTCGGVAYQEVVIVLAGTRLRPLLLPFAHRIILFTTLALFLWAISPLMKWWLSTVFALPPTLHSLSRKGLLLMLPMPALVTYLAYLRGLFIHAARTRLNLLSAVVEISGLILLAPLLLAVLPWASLYTGILALLLARLATLLFLVFWTFKRVRGKYGGLSVSGQSLARDEAISVRYGS